MNDSRIINQLDALAWLEADAQDTKRRHVQRGSGQRTARAEFFVTHKQPNHLLYAALAMENCGNRISNINKPLDPKGPSRDTEA